MGEESGKTIVGMSGVGESIYETLKRLGLANDATKSVLSTRTRDVPDLPVFRDETSGVIFIDRHYVGDDAYRSGAYRQETAPSIERPKRDLEDCLDTERRLDRYKQFVIGKNVCDFGCGRGAFLRSAKDLAESVVGVELQRDFADRLNKDAIQCVSGIDSVENLLDSVFMFHSLEHLPNPSKTLKSIRAKLKEGGGGKIIIEVPHAKDFLMENMSCQAFQEFTLWSQHLVLHTRQSLKAFLQDAGFRSISIEGVQRYGLANHLNWLRHAAPGGHKTSLSVLETAALKSSYADALSKLDANDTLVAVAST